MTADQHTCDSAGPSTRVVDESGDVPAIASYPTCSVCGKPQVFAAPAAPRITERDVKPGDWIEYRDEKGVTRHAKVRALYPFGKAPTADTSLGLVPLSAIVEVRRRG